MSLDQYSKKFCCKGKKKKSFVYKDRKQDMEILFCFVSVCFKMREKAVDLTTDVKDHAHD